MSTVPNVARWWGKSLRPPAPPPLHEVVVLRRASASPRSWPCWGSDRPRLPMHRHCSDSSSLGAARGRRARRAARADRDRRRTRREPILPRRLLALGWGTALTTATAGVLAFQDGERGRRRLERHVATEHGAGRLLHGVADPPARPGRCRYRGAHRRRRARCPVSRRPKPSCWRLTFATIDHRPRRGLPLLGLGARPRHARWSAPAACSRSSPSPKSDCASPVTCTT